MHHKPSLRARKQKFLASLLQPGVIVAIQEVHGTQHDLEYFRHTFNSPFQFTSSFVPPDSPASSRTGGVATFFPVFQRSEVRQQLFGSPLPLVTYDPIVPGRVLHAKIRSQDGRSWISHFNERRAVSRKIRAEYAFSQEGPHERLLFVAGDFNFSHLSPLPLVPDPEADPPVPPAPAPREWRDALGPL
eukprot:3242827-Pyramimonas_sp.AAC.1